MEPRLKYSSLVQLIQVVSNANATVAASNDENVDVTTSCSDPSCQKILANIS